MTLVNSVHSWFHCPSIVSRNQTHGRWRSCRLKDSWRPSTLSFAAWFYSIMDCKSGWRLSDPEETTPVIVAQWVATSSSTRRATHQRNRKPKTRAITLAANDWRPNVRNVAQAASAPPWTSYKCLRAVKLPYQDAPPHHFARKRPSYKLRSQSLRFLVT